MGKMVVDIPGTGPVDLNKVIRLLPDIQGWNFFRPTLQQRYILALVQSWPRLLELGLDTPLRMGHFLGQGLVETGWLRYDVENLNYSQAALISTFSRYGNDPDLARQHARKPEIIANTVYGGRKDLGNTEEGDGWKFRGRGFIQLTGRANYARFAELTGFDLVGDPDLIRRDLGKSVEAAAMFWQANKLNTYADANDASRVSRAVNRGNPNSPKMAKHEDVRILWTNKALELTGAPDIARPDAPSEAAPAPASLKPLQTGSRGERVKALQQGLLDLGYKPGPADGIFGGATRRALVAFQHEEGLAVTGIADAATLEALDRSIAEPRNALIDTGDPKTFG